MLVEPSYAAALGEVAALNGLVSRVMQRMAQGLVASR